jgi:hypothetical protein
MGKEWLSVGELNVAGRCNSSLLTSPATGTVVLICVNAILPGAQERKTVFNTTPNVPCLLKLLRCFRLVSISRVPNSPGARQAFGAPQNGPGRAASLESLIGSGRGSKNLDVC